MAPTATATAPAPKRAKLPPAPDSAAAFILAQSIHLRPQEVAELAIAAGFTNPLVTAKQVYYVRWYYGALTPKPGVAKARAHAAAAPPPPKPVAVAVALNGFPSSLVAEVLKHGTALTLEVVKHLETRTDRIKVA